MRVIFILIAFGVNGQTQIAKLTPASLLRLPGVADSNSPSHWTDGKLILFNSDGMPVRSEGESVETLGRTRAARFYSYEHVPMWIEATYKAPDGILYAWYHHEVFLNCDGNPVSAPMIGALRSEDDGLTFQDLGIVLSAGGEPDCNTNNKYFAGGHGDFTAIPDANLEYIYFFYSNYSGETEAQGIATARILISDLDQPVDRVMKYFEGDWLEPGNGGAATPVFAATSNWASEAADAFWGPSVHWNTHLNRYVMVMNHTCCSTDWGQEGIYISFGVDLSQPASWGQPVKLLNGGGWYPMVMGMVLGDTDKSSGRAARFYMGSDSNYFIEFDWK